MIKRFTPIRLAWKNLTCQLDIRQLNVAVLTYENDDLIDLLTPHCDPYRDQLCLLTQTYGEEVSSMLCVNLVLKEATVGDFNKYCQLKCTPDERNSPIITPISSNYFVLTQVRTAFNVTCPNKNLTYQNLSEYAALDIRWLGALDHVAARSISLSHILYDHNFHVWTGKQN